MRIFSPLLILDYIQLFRNMSRSGSGEGPCPPQMEREPFDYLCYMSGCLDTGGTEMRVSTHISVLIVLLASVLCGDAKAQDDPFTDGINEGAIGQRDDPFTDGINEGAIGERDDPFTDGINEGAIGQRDDPFTDGINEGAMGLRDDPFTDGINEGAIGQRDDPFTDGINEGAWGR